MPKSTKRTPVFQLRLSSDDFVRFETLCQAKGKTKTQIGREAVRWYLDHCDQVANEKRESLIAASIDKMANRICGMLARQGAEIRTLYELTWNHSDEQEFTAAITTANQLLRKRLDQDEKDLASQMKRIVQP